ncbi:MULTISPECIES: thioredoxin [unclassified Corynebacterium]|uniref:thioredoxin n=1 Tax=unclassified Corynebacterium TaxID=2624378 RepID=UPI00264BDB70|nr:MULTISPECIES: thioredoxin [unclassified Corynebacterium]MDN8594271.1 thioredoxin [Corynebacterium sp. P4_F2]WKK55184.1 thioredoxin [Corynebacterium sp. P4-C1]
MSKVVDVTQDTFKSEVIESNIPVLVDFWAEWCGPCQKLSPILNEVAEELDGRVKIAKVNMDDERTLGALYQVLTIPTVIIFKDGQKVDEFNSLRPKGEILSRVQPHI